MAKSSNYHINFFKPASAFMRDNIKLITGIMVFWALAVFGFHGLMKVIETPTPEPAYIAYQDAWPGIKNNSATTDQKKALAKACLTLTGKYIDLRGNVDIAKLFSSLVMDLIPAAERPQYVETALAADGNKQVDVSAVVAALELNDAPLLARMIPYTLTDPNGGPLSDDAQSRISGIMEKYLIHYQSFLTDTQVFGFPLHYFYTAVLLMIIFCLLCLAYCAKIDKVMVHYGLEADEA